MSFLNVDVVLNKRHAGQAIVFCILCFSLNDSMFLAVRKRFLRRHVFYRLDRTSNVFVDVHVGQKNHNFNIPLILDKYNIMIVMQQLLHFASFVSFRLVTILNPPKLRNRELSSP